jgi:hypothetical protein
MAMKQTAEVIRSREPTIQEEIAGLGDDDLMDFMNLTSERTGIDGVVFISTRMGRHGPRVKFSEKAGQGQSSFSVSIAADPKVLASSLPERVVSRMAPLVIAWVRLNQDALLRFWNEGTSWLEPQIEAFKAALQKVVS